jgi:hypothetical protein
MHNMYDSSSGEVPAIHQIPKRVSDDSAQSLTGTLIDMI